MAEKVTVMILKVDLQCPCCYKKVKKILCKFPQIRDQVYDEKANTVTITVVCCSPEKIRDKLCCKGAKVIKSIEIKEPSKPKEPQKPNETPKEPEKPKEVETEKPKEAETPKEPEKPKEHEEPKVIVIEKPKEPEKPDVVVVEKPKEPEKPKEADKPKEKPKEAPKPEPPKKPEPAPSPPPPEPLTGLGTIPENGFPQAFPVSACCGPCYEGYGGGPCYHGYGTPPQAQPYYDDYYGYGYGGKGCHISRCDDYFSEENPRGCSIM